MHATRGSFLPQEAWSPPLREYDTHFLPPPPPPLLFNSWWLPLAYHAVSVRTLCLAREGHSPVLSVMVSGKSNWNQQIGLIGTDSLCTRRRSRQRESSALELSLRENLLTGSLTESAGMSLFGGALSL